MKFVTCAFNLVFGVFSHDNNNISNTVVRIKQTFSCLKLSSWSLEVENVFILTCGRKIFYHKILLTILSEIKFCRLYVGIYIYQQKQHNFIFYDAIRSNWYQMNKNYLFSVISLSFKLMKLIRLSHILTRTTSFVQE